MAVLVLLLGGCASSQMVKLRSAPHNPLSEQLHLTDWGGPKPSDRTAQFLRVYDLSGELAGNPRPLLQKVQAIIEREPSAEKVYAAAELSYLEAKKVEGRDRNLALDLYGAAVLHAYQYLFDDRFRSLRNPYDPQFRGACELYNSALEAALRIAIHDGTLAPDTTRTIQTAAGSWDIQCVLRGGRWRKEDFAHFEFVSDYEMTGLKNHYQSYGLGVPLIAVRHKDQQENEPAAAKYYPPGLSFPVTAVLRPEPEPLGGLGDSGVRHHGVLELYDSAAISDMAVGNLHVPLESDLTTPLAYFLSNPDFNFDDFATAGLLRPERLLANTSHEAHMGLYMVQPYEPGKIPVLMVHGLWSSPMTWMQMFNDLRSSPEIRDQYQFWFYLYPTAQPFWISAAQLRRDLAETRQTLDPQRQEPALDQMVLVGHSMGGLVSRLQTIDSRNDFWKIVSDQPFENLKANEETRERIAQCFFFEPNPSIRRVITIATPHRGSTNSSQTTQWLARNLIRLPQMLAQGRQQVIADNPGLFRDNAMLKIENSIDSLSPKSPVFPVMLASYRAPWVKYHNIVGVLPDEGLTGWWAAGGDGVVSFESAHMEDVESEITVPANHTTVHAHPLAVLEVKRILLRHLVELRGDRWDSQVQAASLPPGTAPESSLPLR